MDFYVILTFAVTVIFGYLIGSVNSSIAIIRLWKKEDIREKGSKNAGLTNTLRLYGKKAALFVLIADLLKGVLAVLICRLIANLIGADIEGIIVSYVAGISVMIGHIFPIYYGFKGGKGVLIAATTLLAIDPLTFAIVIPIFAIILIISNYVSLSSIIAAISYPIVTYFTQNLRGFETVVINSCLVGFIAILIVFMHRSNIKRLINGNENKFRKNK